MRESLSQFFTHLESIPYTITSWFHRRAEGPPYGLLPKVLKRAHRRPAKHRKSMIWMLSHAQIDPRIFLSQKKKNLFFSKKKIYFFFEKSGSEIFRPSIPCPSRAKTIITMQISRPEAFRSVQERPEASRSTQKHSEAFRSAQKHEKTWKIMKNHEKIMKNHENTHPEKSWKHTSQ